MAYIIVEGILFLHPDLSAEMVAANTPIKFIHELAAVNPEMPFNHIMETKIDCVSEFMRAKISLEALSLKLREEPRAMLGRVSASNARSMTKVNNATQ